MLQWPWFWFALQICACFTLELNTEKLCSMCECKKDFLDCSGRNISVLPALEHIPNVINLSFDHNFLVHVIPFERLSVKTLSFTHNAIQSIDECAFKNLIYLTNLDLSHNLLTTDTLLPNVFKVNVKSGFIGWRSDVEIRTIVSRADPQRHFEIDGILK